MFRSLQQLLRRDPTEEKDDAHRVRIATAALLLEMTRADFSLQNGELARSEEALVETFEIEALEARDLLQEAETASREAIEVFQFTRILDREFSPIEKVAVIERLWFVALADHHLDEQEEYLVRKVANLLHVPHPDFIAAKKRARERIAGSSAD